MAALPTNWTNFILANAQRLSIASKLAPPIVHYF